MSESAELEDAKTALRMTVPVSELEYLASRGDETAVSGDALAAYSVGVSE